MNKIYLLLLSLFILLSSCGQKKSEEFDPIIKSEISGEILWKRITIDQDYTKYDYWKGHEGMNPGQSPHGLFHKVYVNRTAFEGIPVNKDALLPEGSIIVKENLDENEKLGSLTVMAKVKGFDSDNNDWYWAKYSPDGKIAAQGSPKGCISCHVGMKKNDYIIIKKITE